MTFRDIASQLDDVNESMCQTTADSDTLNSTDTESRLKLTTRKQCEVIGRLDATIDQSESLVSAFRQTEPMREGQDQVTVFTSGSRVVQYKHLHIKAVQRFEY